ncbi:hypothetical protein PIB30_074049, partial [Stylosanthes scabra]|nr:hypothetical protein [Stylosanthes scabra]
MQSEALWGHNVILENNRGYDGLPPNCHKEMGQINIDANLVDPKRVEAHGAHLVCDDNLGLRKLFRDEDEDEISNTSGSCPYPPGFGPCLDGAHVHKEVHLNSRCHGFGSRQGLSKNAEYRSSTSILVYEGAKEVRVLECELEEGEKIKHICEDGGITFEEEDDDVLLRMLINPSHNKGEDGEDRV